MSKSFKAVSSLKALILWPFTPHTFNHESGIVPTADMITLTFHAFFFNKDSEDVKAPFLFFYMNKARKNKKKHHVGFLNAEILAAV